jgi:calcium/calmodulin-dependent protein kinase I
MFGITGEPAYSAPELSAGTQYDERVDVWSAGIITYYMLSRGKTLKFDEAEETIT